MILSRRETTAMNAQRIEFTLSFAGGYIWTRRKRQKEGMDLRVLEISKGRCQQYVLETGSLESLKVWPESLPGDPHMEP